MKFKDLKFSKMQGAGNDFIVMNNMELNIPQEQLQKMAVKLCERRVSIGANALMVVDHPERGGDFQMRFINADGSIAEMCGNGARCIARYACEEGIAGEHMVIETVAGNVEAWRLTERQYKIMLNDPEIVNLNCDVEVDGVQYECSYVELGNPGIPHAVVKYPGLKDTVEEDIRELGKKLRYHQAFPKGANVNFYEIIGEGHVVERTYERGVEDFTLACGTGSGSVACVLALKKETAADTVKLTVPGGELFVEVEKDGEEVRHLYLIGDTNIVAQGWVTDEDLNDAL